MSPELSSIESFAQYLLDDERTSFTVAELQALNARLRISMHEIKSSLGAYGFALELRQVPKPPCRGFTTSSNDRWYGPGSDKTHGGSGFDNR
jgi:hypothetical protein